MQGSHVGQVVAHQVEAPACVAGDLKEEDQGGRGGEGGTGPEEGVLAEGVGVQEEGHNLEVGGQEVVGLTEAAQTGGTVQGEEVCLHDPEDPEEEAGPVREGGGRVDQQEQDLEEAVGDLEDHLESVVAVLQAPLGLGSGLGKVVLGTCPCHGCPWGTLREGLNQGAPLYLLQTSGRQCLSFSLTASQTGSGTVYYMV